MGVYIEELHIEGFGPLSGVRLRFDAQATVVWGPNEAGKSTLLRFIRSMLYGFATRAQLPERGEPVSGGRHGGRLVLRDGGRSRVLERYGDVALRRGGPVAVLREADGSERPLAQADIERLLLGGVSEQLFRQLYAVSLDELHELRALQGDEIGNYLYHAGMAGGAALTAAGKQLRAEMDRLYKPKGSVQELGMLLARIKELESLLRQGRQELGAYMEALEQMEALNARAEALERALPELRERAAQAQAALDVREWWLRGKALAAEEADILGELSAAGQTAALLQPGAAAEWRSLCASRDAAEAAAERAAAERAALETERAALRWDEALVAELARLEALDLRGDAVQARRGEAEGLESDMLLAEEGVTAALQRLGPGWREADAAAVAALDGREEARAIGERIAEAERRRELLAAEAQRLGRQLAAFDQEGERRKRREDEAPAAAGERRFLPQTREALLRAWHVLDDELQTAESARQAAAWAAASLAEAASPRGGADKAGGASGDGDERALGSRGRLSGRSTSRGAGRASGRGGRSRDEERAAAARFRLHGYAALAAASAAGALWAALTAGSAEGRAASGLLAAVLAAAAVWAWRLARRPKAAAQDAAIFAALRQRKLEAEATEAEALGLAEEALRRLIVLPADGASPESGGLREAPSAWRTRLRDDVYRELDRLAEAEADLGRRTERASRREALVRELRAAEAELEEALAEAAGARAAWAGWLSARRLPAGLLPSALPELAQLAEQALSLRRQQTRLARRAAELAAERAAFEAEAADLLSAWQPPADVGREPALAVKLLHREARQQAQTAAEAARLDARLRQTAAAEAEAARALQASSAAVLAALAAAGAAGEEAYALRLHTDERLRELARERREAELRLGAGRSEQQLIALLDLLERHDEAALALHAARSRSALSDCEAERGELLDARGRLAEKLERLRREAETEATALELEELQAELERLAERYELLALTAELIRRTRVVFEEERQPAVLRQASAWFAELTEGRYVRIAAPGDAPELFVERADRSTIGSAFLSRGTQEQLYLSLRLALAAAAAREQPLPLLLDDLFVHYDEARLGRCARILRELATSRQLVLFTCHRHVAEALAAELPAAKLLRLPELAGRGGRAEEPAAPEAAG